MNGTQQVYSSIQMSGGIGKLQRENDQEEIFGTFFPAEGAPGAVSYGATKRDPRIGRRLVALSFGMPTDAHLARNLLLIFPIYHHEKVGCLTQKKWHVM